MREQTYTIDDIGLSAVPSYLSEPTPSAASVFNDGVSPNVFGSGESVNNVVMADGYWQSSNYVTSVSGWKLGSDSGEFNFAVTVDSLTLDTSGFVKGGQTDYNTGTGFFLGYSGSAYKFSLGNASDKFLTWDGTTLTVGGVLVAQITRFTADNTLQESADTERTLSNATVVATKKKEFVVYYGGTIRVKHETKQDGGVGGQINSEVYINGAAIGSLHGNTSGTYTQYSDDITVQPGDLVQIYLTGNGGPGTGYIKNARLYYSFAAVDPTAVNTD